MESKRWLDEKGRDAHDLAWRAYWVPKRWQLLSKREPHSTRVMHAVSDVSDSSATYFGIQTLRNLVLTGMYLMSRALDVSLMQFTHVTVE